MVNYTEVSTATIREFLRGKGFDPNQVESATKKALVTALVDNELENEFDRFCGDTVDDDESTSFEDIPLEDEVITTKQTLAKKASKQAKSNNPVKGDKGWNEYVLSLFTDEEKVDYTTPEGRKINAVKADGLRRVASLVLGTVIASGPIAEHINYDGVNGLPEAWVKYRIILNVGGSHQEFSALADVSYLNTEDAFLGFALQTAETRAKGRAYKEALGVQTYAIEEFSGKKNTAAIIEKAVETNGDWSENKAITPGQKRSIGNLCEKLGINVNRFINCKGGKATETVRGEEVKIFEYNSNDTRYSGLDDKKLLSKSALTMIAILNDFQQNVRTVHESLKELN